ncbi:MAG TPA: hypothetical protein ENN42_09240 [Thioalkalivibrio sp.]|nr:hypothetical protein [Thioalkalivibrio sp.]
MIRLASTIFLLVCALASVQAAERQYQLSAEEWARPRQGDLLVAYPGLNQAIREWGRSGADRIRIRHPAGEAGELWAGELRDWLIALGIASTRIETVPGSPDAANIDLIFHTREETTQ